MENEKNLNVAPDQDAELDAALAKSFGSKDVEEAQVQTTNEDKEPRNLDSVHESPKSAPIQDANDVVKSKEQKPVEQEKPILSEEDTDKLKPTDKGAWGSLKTANKTAHRMIEQRDSEINKLKALVAEKSSLSQKEMDALKAEKADLEKYRAMVDIQADPEFISKYDQPIEKSITGIKELIKSLGVTQATVDDLDFNNPKRMEECIDLIAQNADLFTASKIERKIKDYLDLKDKRDETLKEQQKNFKDTLESKKKESFAKQSESEGRMIKHLESQVAAKDKDGKPSISFLNKMEIRDGALQGEIDQAKNHNALVDQMNAKIQEVFKMKDPEQQAEIAIAAVASHWFSAQNKALTEKVAKLEAQLNKVASINSENPSRKPVSPSRNGNHELPDAESAVNQYFSRNI